MEDKVTILIEGETGGLMSFQFTGTRSQLIDILYSAMREDQEVYFLLTEACHHYEMHLSGN